MKYKKRWAFTKVQLRRDQIPRMDAYTRWWRGNSPVKYDHKGRRAKIRINIQKIFTGEDPDLMHWPTKWHRIHDYYY